MNKRFSVVYKPLWWVDYANSGIIPKDIVLVETDSRIIAEREMKKRSPISGGNPFYKLTLRANEQEPQSR